MYCEAVASLPEKCRQVFLVRKVHGLAHKEIASRMLIPAPHLEMTYGECDEVNAGRWLSIND